VDFFACILIKDRLSHEGITEHLLAEILRVLRVLLLGFGGVYLGGRLDVNVSPGGLRDSQRPPQDSVNSNEEPVIGMRKVSRFPPMRQAIAYSLESWTSNPDLTSAPSMRIEATSLSSFSASVSFSSSLLRSTTRANRPSINGDLGLISRILCFFRNSVFADFSWLWAASRVPQ
jgi:hypothetical protein